MSRLVDDLCPRFRPGAFEVIARLIEQKFPILIVDTLRTIEEQQNNIARKVSWTMNSLHLPQTRCFACGARINSFGTTGLSHAIDVVPYEVYQVHGPDKVSWDVSHPAWEALHKITAIVPGVSWGGNWSKKKDYSHIELAVGHGPRAIVEEA